jgi:hypothetical protein
MRVVLLALALLLPSGVMAQDADTQSARREAARDLIQAANAEQLISDTLLALRGQLIANLRQAAPNLSEAQITGLVDEILLPEFHARRGEMVTAMELLYAERLTVSEMRYATTFYSHPTGQRLLRLMPGLMASMAEFGAAWGGRVAVEAVEKHRDALRARGLPL